MTRHWHPTLERIVHRLKPSAESLAAAAAVYSPDLMLQLDAMSGAVEGPPAQECDGRSRVSTSLARSRPEPRLALFDCRRLDAPDNDALFTISLCAQLSAIVGDGSGLFGPFPRPACLPMIAAVCARSAP